MLHPITKAFNSVTRLVFGTHKFYSETSAFIFSHCLSSKRKSHHKICILSFKIKNIHSSSYSKDLIKLPPRKIVYFFSFFVVSFNHNYAKNTLFYCRLPLQNSLFPKLTSTTFLFFQQNSDTHLFQHLVAENIWNESALYKWFH